MQLQPCPPYRRPNAIRLQHAQWLGMRRISSTWQTKTTRCVRSSCKTMDEATISCTSALAW